MTTAFEQLYLPGGDHLPLQDSMETYAPYENTFSTVNEMAQANRHTVSPQELMMPAPGSSNYSFMDTPESSLLESPAMGSSVFNTTPLQDGELDMHLNYDELKAMGPLFTQDDHDQFAHDHDQFAQIPLNPGMQMNFSPQPQPSACASPMARQKSSPGRPPILGPGHGRKPSVTTGVSKPSRSRGNLAPIEITSDDDKDTAKRKKNTAAARKSRERKNHKAECDAAEIQRLRTIIYSLGLDPDDDAYFK